MGWSETRAFLSNVVAWPEDNDPGFVNLHYSVPNDRGGKDYVTGKPFRDIDRLVSFAEWARGSNIKEMWFCLSLQSSAGQTQGGKPKAVRLHQNALKLKAIWVDIDVKDDGNHYGSIEEAWQAFSTFRTEAGLPPASGVVKSGGGLHVYWISATPLTPGEWAPYAHGLKSLLLKHGLKCDAGLTTDDVRLLRLPSTLNYKYDPPRPVELLPLPLTTYDFPKDLAFLAGLAPVTVAATTLPATFAGKTPIFTGTDKLSDGIERQELPPLPLAPIESGCAFIRDALATGGKDYSQPMWNLTTLAATFMEDGHALAHKMGEGHPGYNGAGTDELWARKLRERSDRGLGWPSCQAIQASGCGSCATCPHFNVGKSPLNLATVPVDRPDPVRAGGGLPAGYIHDKDGFVCRVEEKTTKQGEAVTFVHRLLNSKIDGFWAQKSATADTLHFQATYDKGNTIMAHLTLTDMVGGQIATALAAVHVKINPESKRFLEGFFVALLTKLHDEIAAQESQPFGWLIDGGEPRGFTYGGRVYHDNGTETHAGVADANIAQWYRPTGELKPWLDSCKMVTDLERPELDVLVLVAFAAPLMRSAGEDGATVSAYGVSGSGKSTAMKVGLGVWSDPAQTKEGAKTTEKSLFNKMGELRHLPIFWDEITSKATQLRAVSVSFDQTSGVEGGRMTANVTQRARGSWRTMMALSANVSLVEVVMKEQPTHSGGINRVLEYEVGPNDPKKLRSPTDVGRQLALLEYNHGVIGMQYAKFLGNNAKKVDAEVREARVQVERDLHTTQEERFWTCVVSTILLGAKYANQFGTEFHLEALKTFLYATLQANRKRSLAEGGGNNMEDILTQYLKSRAHTQTIWTDGLRGAKGGRAPAVVLLHGPPPAANIMNGIQIRWDVPSRQLLISRLDITSWLNQREVPWSAMSKWIERTYDMEIRKVVLASGTTYKTAQQEHVIIIKVPPDSTMEDVMMQYKELAEPGVVVGRIGPA